MRYVIVSDIHANYAALSAVEGAIEGELCIGKVYYWFLGDLLGYGSSSDAVKCVRWLRFESGIFGGDGRGRWVPGNHEEWIVRKLGPVRKEAIVTLLHQRAVLEQNDRENWEWFVERVESAIGDTQQSLVIERLGEGHQSMALVFTHAAVGTATLRCDCLHPWHPHKIIGDLALLHRQVTAQTVCLLCGHTHYPLLARVKDGRLTCESIRYGSPFPLEGGDFVINPGSVGHPRDGNWHASFAILDTEARTVEFRRVEYNVEAAVGGLREQSNCYSSSNHREAIEYLIRLKQKQDPQASRKDCIGDAVDQVYDAYGNLIHELETADGGADLQLYRQFYKATRWGLEAIPR